MPNTASELEPFGARWPDGSVRFARLTVLLDMRPGQEALIKVKELGQPRNPFVLSPWVARGLTRLDIQFIAGLPSGVRTARLKLHKIIEATDARWTLQFRDRIPDSDLVYDLWITFFSGQDSARFELRLTNSSTASAKWQQDLSFFAIVTKPCYAVIRGAMRDNILQVPPAFGAPNASILMGNGYVYDGQAREWWGDLLFFDASVAVPDKAARVNTLLAVLLQPLYGIATNWEESGAFGPFGYLPPVPPWILDGGRAAAIASRGEFAQWVAAPGLPWEDRPKGLYKYAGTTGSQHDFGAAKFVEIFASEMPDGIQEARFMAGEEAARPVHHLEADGSPVRAAAHPNWVAWSGRTHYSNVVSTDRLGKPHPAPTMKANGWTGKDNEHWSSLVLSSAYLLTTSYSLRRELDAEAELYMSSRTLEKLRPNWSTNGLGPARAVGRTFLSMSWNYLCTGREDLRNWMKARVEQNVLSRYVGLGVAGPVKPLQLHRADPRVISWTDFWSPWEEAQAVMGLEACSRVTGSLTAHQLAVLCAKNLFTFGWRIAPNDVQVGYGIAWKPRGIPLTPAQYLDPNYVMWPNSGFNLWSLPSAKLALAYGMMYGDSDLAVRALTVIDDLKKRRVAPRDKGWDAYAGWDAVR